MELTIRRPTWWELVEDGLFGGRLLPAIWTQTPAEEKLWLMPVEFFEKEDKYVVRAELPGLKLEDIDVSVTDNVLTIKGERKIENEVKEEDYYYREHSYGTFCRALPLPSGVNGKKIEASYENGILEVGIPKTPEAKPKKITVSAKKKESKQA